MKKRECIFFDTLSFFHEVYLGFVFYFYNVIYLRRIILKEDVFSYQ
jgi:hypothetical protein